MRGLRRMGKERPGALLARRTRAIKGLDGRPHWSCALGIEEGMEPDDFLCSRNARSEKTLVRRAHSRIDQAALEKINRDGADARSGESTRPATSRSSRMSRAS